MQCIMFTITLSRHRNITEINTFGLEQLLFHMSHVLMNDQMVSFNLCTFSNMNSVVKLLDWSIYD